MNISRSKKYRADDFEMRILKCDGCYLIWTPSKLLAHMTRHSLKEYSLEEVVEKTRSTGLNLCLLNLCCFIFLKVTITIPQFLVPLVVKYERMVQEIIRAAKINSQHRLMYIIISPICIEANKQSGDTVRLLG
jgi:hypothetical protein